ncbi:MAG: minor extracellular serine protease Vpr [Bacteroidia bacterium]|jgi:minor extracellular serine protease Vpr
MQRILYILSFLLFSTLGFSQVQSEESSETAQRFLAKVTADFDGAVVAELGGRIGSRTGDIITLRLTSAQAKALANRKGVQYMQKANKVQPNLIRVVTDLRADSVIAGIGLNSPYTGKDVIIGVTDWGFDYTHPMFYDTALQHTRIVAAWDQFKRSGPTPTGYEYGTVYQGEDELLAAGSDTANIYGNAYHGTHVAGIAGGSGGGTEHRGVAYEAEFLFVTFLVDEAAVIDGFNWMQAEAISRNKRLVINMSWGLYNIGPLDGTSLVSEAINTLSGEGVIFVTSGGNNGDETFHIKRTFRNDTLQSKIDFYRSSNPNLWGQSISMWGEENENFGAGITIYTNDKNLVLKSPLYYTDDSRYVDSFLVVGSDTVFYNVEIDAPHPLNNKPHIRLRVKNENTVLNIGLKSYAASGTVHYYNVTELTTDVGNWGMPFTAWFPNWESGDALYSLGEPASTASVITVAAHQSEIRRNGVVIGGGFGANFSSFGPTIDERLKPDVSAPGVNVMSSISSFTDATVTIDETTVFNGKSYPFSRLSGTSMSSPATAGVVALMLEANPNLWYNEAKEILIATAREDNRTGVIPSTGSTQWGWGKVNAYAAVQRAEEKLAGVKVLNTEEIVLYPNPASDVLSLTSATAYQVELISYDGSVVASGQLGGGEQLDVAAVSKGMYLVRFLGGEFKPRVILVN